MLRVAHDVDSAERTDDILVKENIDFKSLIFCKNLSRGLLEAGFIKPSPIQLKAIPFGRCGSDLIVQAKSGTGKTCVFTVIALDMVDPSLDNVQVIVLAPTREIALQIKDVFKAIGKYVANLKVEAFLGGTPFSLDVKNTTGCHIAVGAPGRILHLIREKHLDTRFVKLFIFDEADKLMEDVFKKDAKEIFNLCNKMKQVIACSATFSPELLDFLGSFMNSGLYITPTEKPETMLLGIRQFVSILPYHTHPIVIMKSKQQQLFHLLSNIVFNQCLVFSNFHSRAKSLSNVLTSAGWPSTWINGKMEQSERILAINRLKEQDIRVLVTTDLTARGIDAANVNLIINLDVPFNYETYLHRMGRAGRYGSYGIVITVIVDGEEKHSFCNMLSKNTKVHVLPQDQINNELWTTQMTAFQTLEHIPLDIHDKDTITESVKENELLTEVKNKDEPFSKSADACNQLDENVDVIKSSTGQSKCDLCECRKVEVDPTSIHKSNDQTLYALNEEFKSSNQSGVYTVSANCVPLNVPFVIANGKIIRLKKTENFELEQFQSNQKDIEKEIEENKQPSNNNEHVADEIFDIDSMVDIIEELRKKELQQLKLCEIISTIDKIGWLFVDNECNLIEDIQKSQHNEIIMLKLLKCNGSKCHIDVLKFDTLDRFLQNDDGIDDTDNFEHIVIPSAFSDKPFTQILDYYSSFVENSITEANSINAHGGNDTSVVAKSKRINQETNLTTKGVGKMKEQHKLKRKSNKTRKAEESTISQNLNEENSNTSTAPDLCGAQDYYPWLSIDNQTTTNSYNKELNSKQDNDSNLGYRKKINGNKTNKGRNEKENSYHTSDIKYEVKGFDYASEAVEPPYSEIVDLSDCDSDCDASVLDEFQQWYSTIRYQRQIVEYNAYMSQLFHS